MTATLALTTDLQRQVLDLEDDLRVRVAADPDLEARWKTEHQGALTKERTAASWVAWRDDRITQAAVAWVLTSVFIRFCEDNALVEPVWITGPEGRRQEALDAQLAFFRAHPEDTDREWLQSAIDYLAGLPATKSLVDSHSALHLVSPSGDAVTKLLDFWRDRHEDGTLVHDLPGPPLSTRFLGDLYQDLSQHAKDTYALLQTPVFVEEFILDRTLEPALKERPLEGFKLIDPTCGSGHFLLGAFDRLLDRWHRHAPGLELQSRVQAALDAIHGVDLNPFAVAIARFRLTVAALKACGLTSLEKAPAFTFRLAVGDSLIHGPDPDVLPGMASRSAFMPFTYTTEDGPLLLIMLEEGTYDVVVGNPPYITVKDKALNQIYRSKYAEVCKGKYALTAPFLALVFALAKDGERAGWVGQITSNSFMKREFGSKLVEDFLAHLDLQLVADTSGAYIPGHGTPTVIEAKTQVRTPVQYFDVTFSVSKSITLLHASAMANAAKALSEGDWEAGYWEQAAAEVWACIEAGNRAALEYLQREAGYTRSGYHGRQVGGVRTGRWEDAHGFIIGSFAQHTSRDGDPQLHIHNLVLNRVRRERDGAWRTLDSQALYEHRGAAAAIATLVMESALSRTFGTRWVQRADGHGREIRGVSRELMEQFSSRRQTISALTGRLAARFEAQHGYAPDARALGKLRQWANHASRRLKDGEPLDLDSEVRRWAAQARASEAGALEPVMPGVTSWRGPGDGERAELASVWELTVEQERDLMGQALARVQEAQPTWRKADLIRHLGELIPDDVACRDDDTAAGLLERLAERVLAGGAGQEVLALEAPEWPPVPQALRRADGRSIYRPHSGTRYATMAQLTMEEQMAAQAQQSGAPRLTPEMAALLLGADQAQLEAQLQAAAQDPQAAQRATGSGLRLDQAAAAFVALTNDRRAEILVGPAGSGKTRTAALVARLWREAGMGEVYGLTTSQAARNVLHQAGVHLADNTAEFLGHLHGQREARGRKPLREGTLLLLDEASMMSMADMAAIIRQAAARNCRFLITGDHEQLAAVEGGGGMMMLTRTLGYVQLAEPVRFVHEWERKASLRLRAGDTSALARYEEQGRLRGGTADEAMELACRAWAADHLAGRDSLLLARTGEQARELSRRVRDDLIHYGLVRPGGDVSLRDGAVASVGDLIVARRNERSIIAGGPRRWLTNRDVLRIEGMAGAVVTVRRLDERDPESGRRTWSEPFTLRRAYLLSHCDLAYATTPHAAQGRTVDNAHVLVDGLADRQGLYVAMTRGREGNYAYAVTGFPRAADIREGSQPAAELARMRRLVLERAGRTGPEPLPGGEEGSPQRDPVSVLAEVLGRDGAVLSATETLRAELANADHLGVLGSIWYDLTRQAQITRFERALRDNLPAGDADAALSDAACTWLWRALREAEAAGLDGAKVLRLSIATRPLAGARDLARVIDSRVRRIIEHTVPTVPGSWSARVPETGEPELDRFLRELGAAMDDRVSRIGEHAAQTAPAWATCALGEVPGDPAKRADWQDRAAKLGAYRELYGYQSADDAIGPEPGRASPEARADWHAAFTALGRIDGIDLRGLTDDQLMLRRVMYERETSWAPAHVGEELRLARLQAQISWENAIRAEHDSRAATDTGAVGRHRALATMWRCMETKATWVADTLASVHETRRQWEALTEHTRRVAVAADQELRRRRPALPIERLRSAEPPGIIRSASEQGSPGRRQPEGAAQLTLDGGAHLLRTGEKAAPGPEPGAVLSTAQREVLGQIALGLTPETVQEEIPGQVLRIRDNARKAQEEIDKLSSVPQYAEDDDSISIGTAWASLARRDRDAILQPPKPDVAPAHEVLQRVHQRGGEDREPEHG